MALFVRASRIAPMEEQAAPALMGLSDAKPSLGRRPGFFGRLGNRLRNADWQMAFAQMRDDPSFAENLLSHRENAAEQARREAEAESQRVAAKGTNADREAYIATLDPQAALAFRAGVDPQLQFGGLESIDGRLGQRDARGQYHWAPQLPSQGAGGVQYRPVTPDDVAQFHLPGNGSGFVIGSNGLPRRVGGGGTFSADQRARVAIGIEPVIEAVNLIDEVETRTTAAQRAQGVPTPHDRTSPRNQQWGASIIDMMDGPGTGAFARHAGGQEFQRYSSAASAFEAGMLPILSGAAVTPTEAERMIRAALPQLGDGPQVLADKARRRQQMANGAALIGGRDPPFPQAGIPSWATQYQTAVDSSGGDSGGDAPEGVTQEEWDVMTPEERALWQQ